MFLKKNLKERKILSISFKRKSKKPPKNPDVGYLWTENEEDRRR